MDNSLMPVVRASGIICEESESSCLLQELGSCFDDNGVDICTAKFTVIIFPLLALLIGAICIPLAKKLRITYHLLVLGVGVALGLLGCGVDLGLLSDSLRQWVHVNPPAILLYVFLAPLVFASSFNTNWHVFKRLLVPILISALLLLALQAGLVGAFQMIVIRSEGWSWWSALMFGSMVSATDPIGITTALSMLGASPTLSAFVDGESLVSFGSSIVLWVGFLINASIDSSRDISPDNATVATSSPGELVGDFFKLILGGAAIGVAFALVLLIILSCVYDEYEVETSLTVVVAFLGFWTAQALSELSGVTANVASGLLLSAFGRQLITPSVRKPLGEFWRLLGWIGSTIIFFHAGVLLSAFAWSCAGEPHLARDYVYIVVWYLFLQVVRMVLFLLFRPVLAFRNKWLGWKEAFFLGFSGLRGALSLLLALEVAGSPALPEEVKSRVILWTTGVVALSLLVNGSLLKPVIHGLKLSKAQKPKEEFLQRGRSVMVQRTLQILDRLCVEPGYKSVRWSFVIQSVIPFSWLDEAKHVPGYKGAVERLLNHSREPGTNCIERVLDAEKQRVKHEGPGEQFLDDYTSGLAPQSSRRSSAQIHDQEFHLSARKSASGSPFRLGPVFTPTVRELPGAKQPAHRNTSNPNPNVLPASSTLGEVGSRTGLSSESVPRATHVDNSEARQDSANDSTEVRRRSPTIASSVQIPSRGVDCQESNSEETAKDREVRSRMLTAMLSHVRAITNASLVEYSVLVHLEEDIQRALDANGEGKEYDLFSFISSAGTRKATFWYRGYLNLIERKRLRGESLITKTVVVMGILTSVLTGRILADSPLVRKQAERLHEGAATLLNRLEALNPYALGWVTSQFAIYLTEHSQDSVLSDLLRSGVIDEHEFGVMQTELVQIRRKHVNSQSPFFRLATSPDPEPKSLLREHPLFAGLNARRLSQVLDQHGTLVHLLGGQELQIEKGSLVLVLQGAIQPVENTFGQSHSNKQNHVITPSVSRMNTESPVEVPSLWRPAESLRAEWGSSNRDVIDETRHREIGMVNERPCSVTLTHWCFSRGNAFCGHSVILDSFNRWGVRYPVDRSRLLHTRFRCCDHAKSTTVFTLSAVHVKALARVNEEFRTELTRSMAREIVLDSVVLPSPYALSNFFQFAPTDINAVDVDRAFHILERLPYMDVVAICAGDNSLLHLQGPAVLLNGTVQVSIADVDGSRDAVHLLHDELTGPALLPTGGFTLQELTSKDDIVRQAVDDGETSPLSVEGSSTSVKSSMDSEDGRRTIAHVLIETLPTDDNMNIIALQRLRRWTASDVLIDMNGRFGMHNHVDFAPLLETKVD